MRGLAAVCALTLSHLRSMVLIRPGLSYYLVSDGSAFLLVRHQWERGSCIESRRRRIPARKRSGKRTAACESALESDAAQASTEGGQSLR